VVFQPDHFQLMIDSPSMRTLLAITLSAAFAAPALSQNAVSPSATKGTQAAAKPAERKPRKGTKWDLMDVGPFFSSAVAGSHATLKGLSIKLGTNASVCFDTELLRMSSGWVGGFLRLPTGRDGLEGVPEPVGATAFGTPKGPGWGKGGNFDDPRPGPVEDPKGRPAGPMPRDWAHWSGLYVNGDKVVLSYTVGNARVLELPGFSEQSGLPIFTRTFQVDNSKAPLDLLVHEDAGATTSVDGNIAIAAKDTTVTAAALIGDQGNWTTARPGRLALNIPKAKSFQVAIWSGAKTDLAKFKQAVAGKVKLPNLKSLTKGGAAQWMPTLVTTGKLGTNDGPYVVDTRPLPENNPWKSWIRCSGFDFFSGGKRAAVCSVSGDVWVVDGIDDSLAKLTWKRFATGLFQPLGLKIVDDKVYVLGRDQITRLHDLNKDDEADFYENFNNDVCITAEYHEFALNLETDSKGNFYFTKGGNLGEARHPHHGTLIRVSKDGSKLEVVGTGLRAPNGLGIGPNDEITTADNEGNWVPSSRVNLHKPGGFYGHVFTSHTKVKPTTYDPPLFWLPHTYDLDNSSGGQVWVTSDKWGPLSGRMLHTSYGACALFAVMHETVDGVAQAGTWKFPLKFDTGIMRGRFNKRDGQLYLTGLVVWQSKGARQGGLHRVRYTGKPARMPLDMHVKTNAIEITFADAIDPSTATDLDNYSIEQWNYKWTQNYGSPEFSVANPDKKGHDKVEIQSARLGADGKTLTLEIPGLQPVMQMRIKYNLKTRDGSVMASEIHNTINKVPGV
jgi:hypothetical protein